MRLALTGTATVVTLALAFAVYGVSVSTRRLELEVQAEERRLERLQIEIAVLKADRAFLARPVRIEPAARAIGMRPAAERQYVRIGTLPTRSDAAVVDGARP